MYTAAALYISRTRFALFHSHKEFEKMLFSTAQKKWRLLSKYSNCLRRHILKSTKSNFNDKAGNFKNQITKNVENF